MSHGAKDSGGDGKKSSQTDKSGVTNGDRHTRMNMHQPRLCRDQGQPYGQNQQAADRSLRAESCYSF